MGSESPQRAKTCCFWFSTKKKIDEVSGGSNMEEKEKWEKKDEILSDMSTFSVREQERRLKKALKDEERVSREAEKVVQWVKQESSRMDDSVIKSVLNHDKGTIIK
ncbi:uncharacterized protein LOC132176716 [Corylus avellana]|uniref:uncharacterized protein LOC132176716 n=1 Tax=Corylus avellana TaxID=13451 RepID=UPI00286B2C82|nr:uncharacterized protein LOC132176716 [Corylus avellana]